MIRKARHPRQVVGRAVLWSSLVIGVFSLYVVPHIDEQRFEPPSGWETTISMQDSRHCVACLGFIVAVVGAMLGWTIYRLAPVKKAARKQEFETVLYYLALGGSVALSWGSAVLTSTDLLLPWKHPHAFFVSAAVFLVALARGLWIAFTPPELSEEAADRLRRLRARRPRHEPDTKSWDTKSWESMPTATSSSRWDPPRPWEPGYRNPYDPSTM